MQSMLKRTVRSLHDWFGKPFPKDQFLEGNEPSDCEFVPQKDPHWIWDRRALLPLTVWWNEGSGIGGFCFYGDTGSGKSAALRNFAAALNVPFYERTIYEGLEFADVLTTTDFVDGDTLTHYGLLPQAMGAHGYPGIFCADDVDRADTAFLSAFYEVLEGQPVVTNVGGVDVVKPQRGFRIAATANTALRGDQQGVYQGARAQDIALGDRFMMAKTEYLGRRQEKALLRRVVPDLDESVRNVMVVLANEYREQFMGNSKSTSAFPFPMSTRTLVRWARLTLALRDSDQPLMSGLALAFLNRADDDPPVRKAMEKLAEGKIGTAFSDVTGQAAGGQAASG